MYYEWTGYISNKTVTIRLFIEFYRWFWRMYEDVRVLIARYYNCETALDKTNPLTKVWTFTSHSHSLQSPIHSISHPLQSPIHSISHPLHLPFTPSHSQRVASRAIITIRAPYLRETYLGDFFLDAGARDRFQNFPPVDWAASKKIFLFSLFTS